MGAYYGLEFFHKQKIDVHKHKIVRHIKTITLTSTAKVGIWYYYGILQGGKRVNLSFRVSGPLKNILVEKGASAKKISYSQLSILGTSRHSSNKLKVIKLKLRLNMIMLKQTSDAMRTSISKRSFLKLHTIHKKLRSK